MLGEYRIDGRGAAEIAASIERGVGMGALPPGHVLPPQRELATVLGVNHNTVAAAYRVLRERGIIETAGRRGSRVRSRPASTPREARRVDIPPGVRDLSTGNPAADLLPPMEEALVAAASRWPTLYGAPGVLDELAQKGRTDLDTDGVPEGSIAVTSGSLDAIERVLTAHLRPGDAVAVEDPGWGNMLDLLPALGLRTSPVALDDEGPLPQAVERALSQGARALVVTARAQNPTGAAISAQRSADLRTVLADHPGTLLVEDDHGHGIVELEPYPLAGATDIWAFVRSTAKAYGPDLRVAYLTGDPVTVDRVQGKLRLGPGWVSHLLQHAVVHLWNSAAVESGAVAHAYARRREALLCELASRGVHGHGQSGLNVWVPVLDETGVVTQLMQSGWAVAPGTRFRHSSAAGVRVTVSDLSPSQAPAVATAMADALRPRQPRRYD